MEVVRICRQGRNSWSQGNLTQQPQRYTASQAERTFITKLLPSLHVVLDIYRNSFTTPCARMRFSVLRIPLLHLIS